MRPSIGDSFCIFINDAIRQTWVYPLKEKSHVFQGFEEFLFHKLINLLLSAWMV